MSAGLGSLSSVGGAKEATPGVGAAVSVYWPILSESVKANREVIESGSIVGDSMVQAVALGISAVEGGVSMEFDGEAIGQPILFWNGIDGYDVAAYNSGWATAAPTGSVQAGGTIPIGVHNYYVASILTHTILGHKIIAPRSTVSADITTTSGNQTVDLSWTNAGAPPSGYTLAGTAIYRSVTAGGGASSARFIAYQAGSGTTFTDDGSNANADNNVSSYTAALYKHEFVGSPPVSGDRLPAFSYSVNKNNDTAERYLKCRMDSMKLAVGGPSEALKVDFNLKGTQVEEISNFVPSFTILEPFAGWHALAQIDGVTDCTLESFEINCANNVNPVFGLCNVSYNRDVISGKRQVTGSLTRQFETHDFWRKMLAGAEFSIKFFSYGQPVVANGSSLTLVDHGVEATPFKLYLEIDLFRCKANEAGGNIPGPDRIIETIGFQAFKSSTEGTEMKITMINTIADYDP